MRAVVLIRDLNRESFRKEQLYELTGPAGQGIAVLDLAWPDGLHKGLSEPVAVLLNEGPEVIYCASQRGFRCFINIAARHQDGGLRITPNKIIARAVRSFASSP